MVSKFELPIYYLESKERLDENITRDLELLEVNECNEERNSILNRIFKPKSKIGVLNLHKQCEYFTNNRSYLKQAQKVLHHWKEDKHISNKVHTYDKFYELWNTIKTDEKFIDRYYYVDVEFFKFLNHSAPFLQLLSIYNLISPILSLILPIILLMVPFFMLKFNGIDITIHSYYEVLTKIFSKHALGNIFNIIGDISWEKRIYAIVSVAFYLFSIYQNTLVCFRFYNNFKSIHDDLFLLRDYLGITIENMSMAEQNMSKYDTFKPFLQTVTHNKMYCVKLRDELNNITEFKLNPITRKVNEIGYVMKQFYEFHVNHNIRNILEYSIGFNSYMEHMNGLVSLKREKIINKCKFGKKTKMIGAFNPSLLGIVTIQNDIHVDKNIIITGPNASGKTTILKTILFNLFFSQLYGYGFYSSATIRPYNKLHCYLNIPDTSGRDSLFQAEARRCKEIMDSVQDNTTHFCIFDELFSGTNPSEACASSYGFIKYLNERKNVDFVLTTHLLDICKLLDKEVTNSHMEVSKVDNFNFNYTYILNAGVSTIKGGLKVLYDLEYPSYILNIANTVMTNM